MTRDGITVSSTYIRTLIESGQMERAADFLGHRHCLTRTVTHGCRFGRTIGIPTVNLTPPDHVLLPERGVYVTRVFLPDGTSVPGVTNIGTRPTVSDGDAVSVETFLLDFDGDLYDKTIRVEFCRRPGIQGGAEAVDFCLLELNGSIQLTVTGADFFQLGPAFLEGIEFRRGAVKGSLRLVIPSGPFSWFSRLSTSAPQEV